MFNYDLETFKKKVSFYCDIEYSEADEAYIRDLLNEVKTDVMIYCRRVDVKNKETGEIVYDEFIEELKSIAMREAVRRFLLALINKGQFEPGGGSGGGGSGGEEQSTISSVKVGDTTVSYGSSNKRTSRETTESFQKQLIDEEEKIKKLLDNYVLFFQHGDGRTHMTVDSDG